MKNSLYILLFLCSLTINAQGNLKQLLKEHNTENVPYITVDELKKENTDIILLDAREPKEFKVSHIKNAECVGYDHFNLSKTISSLKNKDAKIIVYCSLGIRSEDVAEKLQKAGFSNVYNLYGGIFEWKNGGNKVVHKKNKPTEKVHTFNKDWSKWLLKGKKVY
ncbi:Rhodanese-related sulfurtransferase [Tenacibaculum sp. MAR_2009_124]|uniref:rhodanese-like domain-containing protein n=1 Tax=Tenacibaculum sp. MAR_2009_124 TaxID=1250059 RepID=UPI0008963035|nr:rhodanese-like domain-containing protein [Tenacibaculum sp. MAR_2009_124]SEC55211.1 Rhodanese-related sulfurtransferase [Tenacibaculum sp. MAR_2009_124]